MNWKRKLETKSRQPAFLWRMVLIIIGLGVVIGYVVQGSPVERGSEMAKVEDTANPWDALDEMASAGQWQELWWKIPSRLWETVGKTGPLALAAITGCCWLAFLWQVMRPQSWLGSRTWLALAGVALGVLSVWPTFFFIYWQEFRWGLKDSSSLVGGLRHYIAGVGLREELAKLLCLLPLMPLLVRMRCEIVALIVSACVGLGFALEENSINFSRSAGSDALGRFLTANPMHMSLTGLVGLACYRGLRNPSGWGPHALATFGLAVIAHGLYDAFIAVPALAEYSICTTIIFALVVYQFFRELRDLRGTGKDVVSLSATFLFGVSVLTAATFVYLSSQLGWSPALDKLVPEAIGLVVMVYLFLREMPETMVTV